jgi:hypothetical protein
MAPATALFPVLGCWSQNAAEAFRMTVHWAMIVPAVGAISGRHLEGVSAEEAVTLLFARGAFDAEDGTRPPVR